MSRFPTRISRPELFGHGDGACAGDGRTRDKRVWIALGYGFAEGSEKRSGGENTERTMLLLLLFIGTRSAPRDNINVARPPPWYTQRRRRGAGAGVSAPADVCLGPATRRRGWRFHRFAVGVAPVRLERSVFSRSAVPRARRPLRKTSRRRPLVTGTPFPTSKNHSAATRTFARANVRLREERSQPMETSSLAIRCEDDRIHTLRLSDLLTPSGTGVVDSNPATVTSP